MTGRAGRWIRRTTIGWVALLWLITGTFLALVVLHGQPGGSGASDSVVGDEMIVAASTTPGSAWRIIRDGARGVAASGGNSMPIFMVERRFAEELEGVADVADGINRINDEEGVRWLYSFLSADRRKTYCLYEAPSPEAIRQAATRAGLPADVIVEVTDRLLPDGASAPI